MSKEIKQEVEFNRPAKYQFIEVLGKGSCGETVRLRDEGMAKDFVAKKYNPIVSEASEKSLFTTAISSMSSSFALIVGPG